MMCGTCIDVWHVHSYMNSHITVGYTFKNDLLYCFELWPVSYEGLVLFRGGGRVQCNNIKHRVLNRHWVQTKFLIIQQNVARSLPDGFIFYCQAYWGDYSSTLCSIEQCFTSHQLPSEFTTGITDYKQLMNLKH